jgi:hypothetical protein
MRSDPIPTLLNSVLPQTVAWEAGESAHHPPNSQPDVDVRMPHCKLCSFRSGLTCYVDSDGPAPEYSTTNRDMFRQPEPATAGHVVGPARSRADEFSAVRTRAWGIMDDRRFLHYRTLAQLSRQGTVFKVRSSDVELLSQ